MRNAEVEPWVHQYVVTLHLLKALDRDRKLTEGMKLARIWDGLMEKLSMLAEREHIGVKQRLRRSGAPDRAGGSDPRTELPCDVCVPRL
ncbi:hypothetical protein LJK88_21010 [Paenibacillus sp. P26]|nr:hypothetical protein LJK88_21010 [Paenibacillus sp. P26]